MDNSTSTFQLLVKSYVNNVISREEYVKIRSQLLEELQSNGSIEESEFKNSSLISQFTNANPITQKSYSALDWSIIILGLTASAVLGFILYG
ncbi:MAG: hypothetical protein ACJAZT_000227 [Gammaproteobacteria bacterium]|jgi:hypothetical protein